MAKLIGRKMITRTVTGDQMYTKNQEIKIKTEEIALISANLTEISMNI